MKLTHTRVLSETFAIERNGRTIGDMVNELIADSHDDNVVTSISVDVTNDDRIALRLLRAPVVQEVQAEHAATHDIPRKHSFTERKRQREDLREQLNQGLITRVEFEERLEQIRS